MLKCLAMGKPHKSLVLLLSAIPLALTGIACLNWTGLVLQRVIALENGRIFGIVSTDSGYQRTCREWSSDLAVETTLPFDAAAAFACTADGATLAFSQYHQLLTVDTASGRIQTKIEHLGFEGGPVAMVGDGQYLATSAGLIRIAPQKYTTPLYVVRTVDGQMIDERVVPGSVQMKSAGNRLGYRNEDGELVVVDFATGRRRQVLRVVGVDYFSLAEDGSTWIVDRENSIRCIDPLGQSQYIPSPPFSALIEDVESRGDWLVVVDVSGNVLRVDPRTSGPQRITRLGHLGSAVSYAFSRDFFVAGDESGRIAVTDLRTGETRGRDLQFMHRRKILGVLIAFGIGFALWSQFLLRDRRDSHRWKTWTGPLIVIGLLHVIWLGTPAVYWAHYAQVFGFLMFLIAVWGAMGSVAAFGAVLNPRHPWVTWIACGAAFVIVPMLPVVGVALLFRWFRRRIQQGDSLACQANPVPAGEPASASVGRGTFSIRQLFVATALCAAGLAVVLKLSAANTELLAAGMGFAAVLLAGLAVAVNRWIARTLLALSLVAMGISAAGFSILHPHPANDTWFVILVVSTTLFLCTHFREAGFILKKLAPSSVR